MSGWCTRPASPTRKSGSRGASLIEVIVMLFVIGLLLALVIPAVQYARESSRRIQCLDNLKQMALGLHGYNSMYSVFPRGSFDTPSLHISMLPFVEQNPLYNAINFQFTGRFDFPQNSTVVGLTPSIFLCPSDRIPDGGAGVGWTNYAGNRGVGVQKYGYNGIFTFFPSFMVGVDNIKDGSQNTALLSEWLLGNTERDPRRTNYHTPRRLSEPEQFDEFIQECRDLNPSVAAIAPHPKGSVWMYGEFGHTFYNHTMKPNEHTCLNGTGYQVGAWTTGSNHNNGINTAFADGHVRFIKSAISQEIWHAIGSRAGGEIIDSNSF